MEKTDLPEKGRRRLRGGEKGAAAASEQERFGGENNAGWGEWTLSGRRRRR